MSQNLIFPIIIIQDLESPTIEEQVDQTTIDDETILIVPSPHGFIQASDVIDTDSVLPLTTLTDPILQHHREESNIIGSSLGSPVSEDSKDVEDLVNCHQVILRNRQFRQRSHTVNYNISKEIGATLKRLNLPFLWLLNSYNA